MTDSALDKALRYRWFIFWTLALGYVLVYFHRLCMSVVAEEMLLDLSATGTSLGILGAAYFYTYALMQLPAGLLSDSWGPRKTITVFFMVAFAGSLIMAWSPDITWAIIGRTLVGIGVSMLFVPTMKVLAEWFKVREFASMTGILVAMGGIGSITATTPLAWMSNAVGWRGSFLIVGVISFFLGVLVWTVVRDRPSDKGWPATADESSTTEEAIALWQGVKRVLSEPAFWPLALWFFFGCAVFFAFIGQWGGPYLMQVHGLSKAAAGNVLMMSALGMVAGSPLHSLVSNRVFKARKPSFIISAAMTLVVVAALTFFPESLPRPLLYVVCFMMGVFTNAIVVIGFTATKELFPVRIAGTSTGLVNLFPFMGGAILQPFMGYLLERSGRVAGEFTLEGYQNAFYAMLVCAVIALVSSFFIKETLKREE